MYATGFATRVDGRGGTAMITGWALTGDPKQKREAHINRRGKKGLHSFSLYTSTSSVLNPSTSARCGGRIKNKVRLQKCHLQSSVY